ncbi:Dcp1p-Dcp2p decapping enzyme complex alpha subunit [Puccinia graminis f. sp. tritici]|uniref:Dcp1p-Dcp2p decapping enzyme complex alpha subunit n=1 Tax=Puccinia graminis f. sp. tritici TaxID=56615 RepID=A0A5B0MCJ8_PUCGR|nr:Dcp1p-Dcp2p decapping enzyme complex alpha subunit [Puccinia graminis f. sp. tritici]
MDMSSSNPNQLAPITPEAALLQLQQQMQEMVVEIKHLKANPPQTPVVVQPSTSTSWQEIIFRNFLKSSVTLHSEVNPDKPILAYDGSNYQMCEDALDGTLKHAFSVTESVIKKTNSFKELSSEENNAVPTLIKNTIIKPLRDKIISVGEKNANKMFTSLKTKCQRSDRRHKINLMAKLIELVNDATAADEFTISKWANLVSDLTQSKMTLDEAVGILLQSHFKPPCGIDKKTFEFSVDQNLNDKDSPSFDDVTTIIQSASSKLKPKAGALDYVPMDLDRIQAFNGGNRK